MESKVAPNNEFGWETVPNDGEQATAEELTSDHGEGNGISDDVEHKTKGALSWSYGYLKKILNAAKGAATFQVVEFIKKHLEGTKLIFIVGETGTGKTSLLEEITGEKLRVGHTLKSGTPKYEIWPAIIHGQQYLFVDTPGFGAGDMNDMEIFENIMNCLFAIGPFVTIAGVLFLHDIKKDRMTAGELKTIRWLQCFCGPQFYQNITFITTKWDELKQKALAKARTRLVELKTSDFAPLLSPAAGYLGGYLHNHGIPGGGTEEIWCDPLDYEDDKPARAAEASDLIHSRYGNIDAVELQIKTELDKGKKLPETEAAKALTTLPAESCIIVARNKAVLLRIGESAPDDKEEDDEDNVGAKNEGQEPSFGSFTESFEQWFNIAKQAAIIFSAGAPAQIASACWQAVKNWWSGPAPARSSLTIL